MGELRRIYPYRLNAERRARLVVGLRVGVLKSWLNGLAQIRPETRRSHIRARARVPGPYLALWPAGSRYAGGCAGMGCAGRMTTSAEVLGALGKSEVLQEVRGSALRVSVVMFSVRARTRLGRARQPIRRGACVSKALRKLSASISTRRQCCAFYRARKARNPWRWNAERAARWVRGARYRSRACLEPSRAVRASDRGRCRLAATHSRSSTAWERS